LAYMDDVAIHSALGGDGIHPKRPLKKFKAYGPRRKPRAA
jgi:hypothetical protein